MNLWRSFRMLSTLSRDRFIADLPYTITSNLGERQFGFKCTHTDWSSSLALPGSLQSIHPYFVIPARNPSAILYFNRFPIKRPPPSSNSRIFPEKYIFPTSSSSRTSSPRLPRLNNVPKFRRTESYSRHSWPWPTLARSLARAGYFKTIKPAIYSNGRYRATK